MPRSMQDNRHKAADSSDERGEAPAYPGTRGQTRRRNPLRALMPVLILAAFGAIIARQQVPAFADWWARTFSPTEWRYKQTCHQAVLETLKGGRYARQLDGGVVHDTQDGPYVADMQFSMLGENGDRQVVRFNCYLDATGRVHRLTRAPE